MKYCLSCYFSKFTKIALKIEQVSTTYIQGIDDLLKTHPVLCYLVLAA